MTVLLLSTALATHPDVRMHSPPGESDSYSYSTVGWLALHLARLVEGVAVLGVYVVVMGGAMWIARSTLPGAPPLGHVGPGRTCPPRPRHEF